MLGRLLRAREFAPCWGGRGDMVNMEMPGESLDSPGISISDKLIVGFRPARF